jgi:hypothetical protein
MGWGSLTFYKLSLHLKQFQKYSNLQPTDSYNEVKRRFTEVTCKTFCICIGREFKMVFHVNRPSRAQICLRKIVEQRAKIDRKKNNSIFVMTNNTLLSLSKCNVKLHHLSH